MIYTVAPPNFNPKFEVVSSYCEYEDTILLLKRHPNKPQGNTWGVPAGKKGETETPLQAMAREFIEETGINENIDFFYLGKVFVRYQEYDFIYHMFRTLMKEKPPIILNPIEHVSFCWEEPKKALSMDLIQDLDACILMSYDLG